MEIEADPDERTVAAAVDVLQFELGLVNGSIDSLDRKAALIPPFLVAAAAFLLGPIGTTYNWLQLVLVALAIATGIRASYLAYRAMAPDLVRLGPKAEIVERYTTAPLADFEQRVVEALSEAVQQTSKTTLIKGERPSGGMRLAAATLLLLVLARIAGGLPLAADNAQTPTSTPPATQPSQSAAPQPTQSPATQAPASPSTGPRARRHR